MSQDLISFNKTNVILWGAILTGIVILSIIVFVLDQSQTFTPIPVAQNVNQILFIVAVIFAFGILILKRSIFSPHKIIAYAVKMTNEEKTRIVLARIRRNYIVVWAMAEVICLIGFLNYIFTVNFQAYLVFAIVSIYSVIINFPRQNLANQCIEQLAEVNE
jgi:hypothetical protein